MLAAYLARLTIWEGPSSSCAGEGSLSVVGVGGVPLAALGLDPVGVPLVDGEAVGLSVAGRSEVAASLGAESAGALDGDVVGPAVLAGSGVGHGSLSSRAMKKKRDAPPESS
jgi:hypothetical protein